MIFTGSAQSQASDDKPKMRCNHLENNFILYRYPVMKSIGKGTVKISIIHR